MNQNARATARTKLKFVESMETGSMISYVTINTTTGRLFGVKRDDDTLKKVVLLSKQVSNSMEVKPNILYDVELIPMGSRQSRKSCRGFVVVKCKPTQFNAVIELNGYGSATVKFGNKTITYNPTSEKESRNNKDNVINALTNRIDLKNKDQVIERFKSCMLEADGIQDNKLSNSILRLKEKHEAA